MNDCTDSQFNAATLVRAPYIDIWEPMRNAVLILKVLPSDRKSNVLNHELERKNALVLVFELA